MTSLSEMNVEELIDAQRANSVARGEAEAPFKAEGQAIQGELNRRAGTAKLEAVLEGMTPEQRAQVLADLQAQE